MQTITSLTYNTQDIDFLSDRKRGTCQRENTMNSL